MAKDSVLQVAVIGYGYWGPNLVRNFSDVAGFQVAAVADLNPARLAEAGRRYPTAKMTSDLASVLNDPKIDAVAIATPVSTHFDLALQALRAGKHVLVEKPLAASSEQAEQLIEEAERRKLVLMVDHTFVYTGAVRRIHELIAQGELGDIYYYDSVRVNLGLFQHDVNVIWDLGVHDLSIMDYTLGKKPVAVSATGISHVGNKPENLAYLTVFFAGSLIAHFHLNWLAPVKIRKTLIGGSRKMIVYDELEPSEKLKVYDKGITTASGSGEDLYKMLVGYRTGDMWAPNIDVTEALKTETKHFLDCIHSGKAPLTDGVAGLRVVRILEAATLSMAQRGKPVQLDDVNSEKAAIQ